MIPEKTGFKVICEWWQTPGISQARNGKKIFTDYEVMCVTLRAGHHSKIQKHLIIPNCSAVFIRMQNSFGEYDQRSFAHIHQNECWLLTDIKNMSLQHNKFSGVLLNVSLDLSIRRLSIK